MLAIAQAQDNPSQLVRISNSVTIADSLNAPTLRSLEKTIGKDDIVTVISMLILRTASYFNIGKNLTEDQALELAFLMIDQYPHETVEDFVLMFNRAKRFTYGKVYDRIDGHVIFGWMASYLEEKSYEREKFNHNAVHRNPDEPSLFMIVQDHVKDSGEKSILSAFKKALDIDEDSSFENVKDRKKNNEKSYFEFKNKYLSERSNKTGN